MVCFCQTEQSWVQDPMCHPPIVTFIFSWRASSTLWTSWLNSCSTPDGWHTPKQIPTQTCAHIPPCLRLPRDTGRAQDEGRRPGWARLTIVPLWRTAPTPFQHMKSSFDSVEVERLSVYIPVGDWYFMSVPVKIAIFQTRKHTRGVNWWIKLMAEGYLTK